MGEAIRMTEQKTMQAAVLREFHKPLCIEEVPIPEPGPGEVLVQVKASGLCVTDLHIQDGIIGSVRLPYTPGHEMAGIVRGFGPGAESCGLSLGQHVVCGIDITCGTCDLCRRGRENLCRNRVRVGFERNGSHAEYAVVPAANLHPISDDVPFDQAAIIPDAVACMYHAIRHQGQVAPGDRVLFYGAGGLALQGVQIAKHLGAEIFAAARTPAKLEKAQAFGASHVINTRQQDLAEELRRMTDQAMCDVIFDLVGNGDTIDLLLRCVRPGGKVVALAYAADSFAVNCQELVIQEKEVLGIRGSTTQDLLDCIRLVEEKKIVPYVSSWYHLGEINTALEALRACKGLGRSAIVF